MSWVRSSGKRIGLGRAGALLGGSIVIAAALWFVSDPERELLGSREVGATITAVHEPAHQQPNGVALVEVKLADGGRGKLFMPAPFPKAGEKIRVTLSEYDNGERTVSAAAP